MTITATEINSCCAQVYDHPAARFLLGDSFHPGGLELTAELASRLGISPSDTVLDAGCGPGASAVHLARTIGCSVVGVTLEDRGGAEASARACREGVEHRVTVVQGDVETVDLGPGRFDAAIAECVVSILPRKQKTLRNLHGLLRAGGRLGITDVTVSGPLPPDLQGVLATAGCVGAALPLDGYAALVSDAGFELEAAEDLPDVASAFLRGIGGKLLIAEIAAKLGKIPISVEAVLEAKRILTETRSFVERGAIGYCMVTARRA